MTGTTRMTRRDFAAQVLSGLAGVQAAAVLAAETPSPRYRGVSAQTYVWSQVLAEKKLKIADSLDLVFGEIHSGGYDGVETMAEFIGQSGFSDLLAKHRLKLSGVYSGVVAHDKDKAKAAVDSLAQLGPRLKTLGCDVLVVNPNPIGREKTDAELDIQAQTLNAVGRALRDSAVALNVHCHAPELRSNAREFRSNLDRTDPALVWLNADVDWIKRGGSDPYELLTRYADRIGSCHLRNGVGGVWLESLGDGDVDYRRIAKIFEKVKVPIWLTVELAYEQQTARTRPLAEDAAASRKYVREIFGV